MKIIKFTGLCFLGIVLVSVAAFIGIELVDKVYGPDWALKGVVSVLTGCAGSILGLWIFGLWITTLWRWFGNRH